jgi:hypothetical protein
MQANISSIGARMFAGVGSDAVHSHGSRTSSTSLPASWLPESCSFGFGFAVEQLSKATADRLAGFFGTKSRISDLNSLLVEKEENATVLLNCSEIVDGIVLRETSASLVYARRKVCIQKTARLKVYACILN